MRRSILLASLLLLFGCVGGDDSSTTKDAGPDVTANDVSTNDVATNDAAGPWTPAALDADGSLAFWFDTSVPANVVISSGKVGKWVDRSKNHNDATNATGGPTVSSAAIHGFDSLHFDAKGVVLTMADSPSLQFSNDQLAIFAVGRANTARLYFFSKHTEGVGGGGTYFKTGIEFLASNVSQDGGTELAPYVHFAEDPTSSGTPTDYPASWNGSVFDDGKFHVVGMRRPDPATMVVFADGQNPQSTSTGGYDISEPGKVAAIGGVGYGNFNPPLDGDIAEVIGVHATIIPDSVVTNIQTYLKTKYGF